jgi:hypothetical protein
MHAQTRVGLHLSARYRRPILTRTGISRCILAKPFNKTFRENRFSSSGAVISNTDEQIWRRAWVRIYSFQRERA